MYSQPSSYMQSNTSPLSVSHVCALLEELVNTPGMITVEGEVSGLIQSRAGHNYFTLKDTASALRCVLFAGAAKRSANHLAEGSKVTLIARASLYAKTGALQLVVEKVGAPQAQGELYAQFMQLKDTLTKEGLFDQVHKRPLPEYPEMVGVITSATGSVRRDIETTLARRFPCATVLLFAADVQGDAAVTSLCRAIDTAEAYTPTVSCIIIGRGGGSLEDLAAFNSESLVRCIHACRLPVVSAVGHQTDTTLCDLVADVRAPTPTAAAELVSPAQDELLLWLDEQQKSMKRLITYQITDAHHVCAQIANRLLRVRTQVTQYQHDLAMRLQHLEQRANSLLQDASTSLMVATEQLRARNPRSLLRSGFAYATTDTGKTIQSITQLVPADVVQLHLQDGVATTRVTDVQDVVSHNRAATQNTALD